jgi:hypothetical protein
VTRRTLNSLVLEGDHAVRKSQLALDRTRRTVSIAVSDDRIFYTTTDFPLDTGVLYPVAASSSSSGGSAGADPVPTPTSPVTLESLRLAGGELTRLPSQELRRVPASGYYYGQLYARAERAFEIFDNTVTVVDTLQPSAPTHLSHELPIWGCQSLEVADDKAFCAAGQRGVEVIDLSSMR